MKKTVKITLSVFIIVVIVMNIVVGVTQNHENFIFASIEDVDSDIEYKYRASGFDQINFIFLYESNKEYCHTDCGTFYLNDRFHIDNFNLLNIMNEITNDVIDQGLLRVSLEDTESCIYIDCVSTENRSWGTNVTQINLLEEAKESKFSEYEIDYTPYRISDNICILFTGTSSFDNSSIKLIAQGTKK